MAAAGYRKKSGRATVVDPSRRKPTFREKAVYSSLPMNPTPGVDYTRVLSGPGHRSVTSVAGVAAIFLSYFILFPLIAQLVLTLGFIARGRPGTSTEYIREALAFNYWEGVLASHIGLAMLIPISILMVKYVHRRDAEWLSSVQPGMRWRFLIICGVVAAVVMNGIFWMTAGRDFKLDPQSDLVLWLVIIFLTTPLQAAAEEYFFRGYLMQVLGSFIKWRWVSVLLSGLLFGAAHGFEQSLPMFATRVSFGVLMGALVLITGGLEAAIAAHVVNNLSAFTYAALDGGVAAARSLTEVTWASGAINIGSYFTVGVICYLVGRKLRVAQYTPALD